MVCQNCGKETKGIKLNGKLFCTFCGEVVKDPTEILEEAYKEQPISSASPISSDAAEAQIITPESESAESSKNTEEEALLEAEEEVLDLIQKREKKNVNVENKTIKKHQRERADHGAFKLIKGEPDPINELELESPHDDLISTVSEPIIKAHISETKYPLIPKAKRDEIKKKHKQRQVVFNEFLKQTAGAIADKKVPTKKQKKKVKPRKHKTGRIILLVTFIMLASLAALVYYVNNIAIIEKNILARIENANFTYKKPSGPPEGYKISYLSERKNGYVGYYYVLGENQDRYLKIKIEPTDFSSPELKNEIIDKLPGSYTMSTKNGLDFWVTDNDQLYVIDSGVLYIFSSSGEMPNEQLLEYAQEMLL